MVSVLVLATAISKRSQPKKAPKLFQIMNYDRSIQGCHYHYHYHYHFFLFLGYNPGAMDIQPLVESFRLPEETGHDPLPRLLRLLEEMMETAGRHAETLGVGVRDLHAKGLTWVLARLHATIAAIPGPGAAAAIATWPCGRHRLFAVREFRLRDAAGAEMLRATSAWALMNLESRRPARLDPHLPDSGPCPERMIADDFAPLPPPHPGSQRRLFRARADDIDLNDHVNNTVYLGWALGAVPAEIRCRQPRELEAAFLGEARLGDRVACLTEIGRPLAAGGAVLLQSLRLEDSGRELTRLRTSWHDAVCLKKTQ